MNRVSKTSLALIAVISLAVGMGGTANAQNLGSVDVPAGGSVDLSIGATSSLRGISSDEPEVDAPTPEEARLMSTASQAAQSAGLNLRTPARQQAESFLPRAMRGEYTFIRDSAQIDFVVGTAFVHRVRPAQIHLLEGWLWTRDIGALAEPGYESSYSYGVAAGTDDYYIYLVEYSYYAP